MAGIVVIAAGIGGISQVCEKVVLNMVGAKRLKEKA